MPTTSFGIRSSSGKGVSVLRKPLCNLIEKPTERAVELGVGFVRPGLNLGADRSDAVSPDVGDVANLADQIGFRGNIQLIDSRSAVRTAGRLSWRQPVRGVDGLGAVNMSRAVNLHRRVSLWRPGSGVRGTAELSDSHSP